MIHPATILCAVLIGMDAIFRRGAVPALHYAFSAVTAVTLLLTTGYLSPAGSPLPAPAMAALHLLCCYLCIRLMWCGTAGDDSLLHCAVFFNAAVGGVLLLWYFLLQFGQGHTSGALYFLLFLLGMGMALQQGGLLLFLTLLLLLCTASVVLSLRSMRALCRGGILSGPAKMLALLLCLVPFCNLLPLCFGMLLAEKHCAG